MERRIGAGDGEAAAVFEAMIYQIAKEAGAMAAVLQGKVDAVLLTGGMAYSERAVKLLGGYVEWIAPIRVYPGEDELQALAEGDVYKRQPRYGPGRTGLPRWCCCRSFVRPGAPKR